MEKIIQEFIFTAIKLPLADQISLETLKREFSIKHKVPFLRNPEIKKVYTKLLSGKRIKAHERFEQLLITKKIRTLSGVAVVAVLTKSYPCPGQCLYCPNEADMPKSYLSNEPAVMRAINTNFDPYLQTQARIRALQVNGHSTEKIELIVMGGTFSYLPKKYQKQFILECFRACNDYPAFKPDKGKSISLPQLDLLIQKEHKKNETATCRIIGLTLETRPDYINDKEVVNFRKLGCTRVELGVQSIYDNILNLNKRGHLVKQTIEATRLLKESGFKINYHMMPGLFGSTQGKDLSMFKELFSNPDFQPDMLKIYPCVVTQDAPILKLWKQKKYRPLSNKQAERLLCEIKSVIPPYVRITRLIRDIPEESIIAGPSITNLRQIMQQKGVPCQCIRCREVRAEYNEKQESILLDRMDYPASNGEEIFLQYVSKDKKKLYALLRLRVNSNDTSPFSVLHKAAIIREVHTYGKLVMLSQKDEKSPQHIGLGRRLIFEAERIAKEEFGRKKIAVISGVGVRNYYKKHGYRLLDTYMIKKL